MTERKDEPAGRGRATESPGDARHSETVEELSAEIQRLKSALQNVEDLLNISPAFFGFLSLDGVVQTTNQLALQVVEATPDQVYGTLFWEAPWWKELPRSAERVKEAVRAAAKGQASHFDIEYWSIQAAVGQKRWVELDVRPCFSDARKVIRIAATGVDITDQQESQEALRRSEDRLWQAVEDGELAKKHLEVARQNAELAGARLSRLFQNAPAFVCSLNGPEHVFEMVNPPYQQLVGGERQLVGKAVKDAVPEVVEQGFIQLLDTVYRTGTPFVGNETLLRLDRHKSGHLEDVFITFVYQPRFDAQVQVDGIDVFGFEVTEHVRVRRAAEAASEEQRILAAAIPQQVWTATPDGALDFVNSRVLDYFQATKEQVLGAGWVSVIHPEDVPLCLERWTYALRTAEAYEIEFRLKRADGVYRWHLGRAVPLRNASGNVVKWFGTNTDVHEARIIRDP